ncbi:MAG: VOC family protein [Kutzneria sp.]|nr:VOC family protein [Kutzneria sp.]
MPNVVAEDLAASKAFYSGFLGLEVRMDEPGFLMLCSPSNPTAQLTVVSGASDWDPNTCRTTMAVEVDDIDAVHAQAKAQGVKIVYPITDEPWGVRRFFVEAPDGGVINVNSHIRPNPTDQSDS